MGKYTKLFLLPQIGINAKFFFPLSNNDSVPKLALQPQKGQCAKIILATIEQVTYVLMMTDKMYFIRIINTKKAIQSWHIFEMLQKREA